MAQAAREVEQEIDPRPLTARQAREKEEGKALATSRPKHAYRERAWICNITPADWPTQYFNFGQFQILGCRDEEPYRMTEITARISTVDRGDKNVSEQDIGALDIAYELARLCNSGMPTRSNIEPFSGIFVCERETPAQNALAAAHEKLRKYYEGRVAEADSEWARRRNPIDILDIDRVAARYLNITEKPWLFELKAEEQEQCPVCRKGIAPETAKCPYCSAILDEDVARRYHLLPAEPATRPQQPKA